MSLSALLYSSKFFKSIQLFLNAKQTDSAKTQAMNVYKLSPQTSKVDKLQNVFA